MNRLDKAALSVIALLLAMVIGVSWMGSLLPLQVMLAQEDAIGPLGPVVLEFNQPVDSEALAGNISLEPHGIRMMEVVSEKLLMVTPARIIGEDEPSILRLESGTYGINGEKLRADHTWTLRPRSSRVVYLGADAESHELFSVGLDGSAPQQLSQTESRIFDFVVGPDGEHIVYSVINDLRGIDLWQMERDGRNARLLLDCKYDHCSAPAFSPDGQRIAYTRESAGISPTDSLGAPRIWVLDRNSGQNVQAYADTQIIGHSPSWSPDGRRLASWDGFSGGIRVLNLETGEDTLLQTQFGRVGAWSPDGNTMLFTGFDALDESYPTVVYQADLISGKVIVFLDAGEINPYFGSPAWSPVSDQVVISRRLDEGSPAEVLWILEAGSTSAGEPIIGKNDGYIFQFYQWNPWGTALVFQRHQPGADYQPEIVVYDVASGAVNILARNASFPMWLP